MLLTIERVALLRRVDLFSQTPDRVLAGVAQVLEEVEVPAGAMVMAAGAVEDWLFVVADGELEVRRGEHRATIPAGAVVGELAVLDPQPRTADVVARTPALLFRLRKAAFDEVMATRPEVAQGVVRELVRRLRERMEPSRAPSGTELPGTEPPAAER
ncbi:MAG: cyclic nucleotide-binding domain-containing protein [Candidatus Nanopelagicales bacterium]|jgi:CRP-like cAMP-binding protein|nr:cyclic nucleotide-binding domain-containing protein [Candidatus Nanopelagicales bacterium]